MRGPRTAWPSFRGPAARDGTVGYHLLASAAGRIRAGELGLLCQADGGDRPRLRERGGRALKTETDPALGRSRGGFSATLPNRGSGL